MGSNSDKTKSEKWIDLDDTDLKRVREHLQTESWGYVIRRTFWLIASVFIQLICCLLISQYDARHVRECDERECAGRIARLLRITSGEGDHSITTSHTSGTRNRTFYLHSPSTMIPVSDLVASPSASIFLNAVMIYGVAVLVFYNMRMRDRHQDQLLVFGLLCGLFAATVTSIDEWSLVSFKDFVPISITGSLVLSLAIHLVLPK